MDESQSHLGNKNDQANIRIYLCKMLSVFIFSTAFAEKSAICQSIEYKDDLYWGGELKQYWSNPFLSFL